MPDPTNVLVIMSDEHRPDALGAAGHPLVQTPALDRLAAEGTRFSSVSCASPLCAPSRAAFATGRYVHETGFWDNATPYDGTPETWGHHLAANGVDVATVGKLDFDPDADHGFDARLPEHRDRPDVYGLHRDPVKQRESGRERILAAGPADGSAWYEDREEARTEAAIQFLEERAASGNDEPWVLGLNYILPHFPLEVDREYYELYPESAVDLPVDYPPGDDHPILEELRYHFDGLDVEEDVLRRTRAAYYGLCTALDGYVGRVLDTLDDLGLADDTLVVYTSDHGEPLGDHGIWWKCCMYEPSVAVPAIVRGPSVEGGQVVDEPVSLLDLVPTISDAVGVDSYPAWRGQSLLPVVRGEREADPERAVFSEYHAHGTSRGMYMVHQGDYKYVYYPENPPQLFHLGDDPDELTNLANDPAHAEVRERLHRELTRRVDPDEVDRRARREQRRRLDELA